MLAASSHNSSVQITATNKHPQQQPPVQQSRNFDHLEYDENLYDFMKSQIPFYLTSPSSQHVTHYLLNEGRGLEKNDVLNLYFNDCAGKRELVNDILMGTLAPKIWGSKELGAYAQELGVVYIDVKGCGFQAQKFVEKLKAFYDSQALYEGVEGAQQEGGKGDTEDKKSFVQSVLSNLYVFRVFTAVEFNATVRSLANFLKQQKNIGLIIIDGLHLIENVEIYSVKSSDKYGSSSSGGGLNGSGVKKRGAPSNIQTMAAQGDIPTSDDFFSAGPSSAGVGAVAQSAQLMNNTNNQIRQSFNIKRGVKMGQRLDFGYFDSKLIERAIGLLSDYKKIYQFAVINCMAKPNLKKTADLLEQVMTRGLQPEQHARQIPREHVMPPQHALNQVDFDIPTLEGQVIGADVDNVLREAIKSLKSNEILVLRGDRQSSLMPRDARKIHEALLSQHLSCCIMPQHFKFAESGQNPYVKRFLALFMLYKINVNQYMISDDVAKSFYI